jgi:uncharacterized delta-60 repeat protein
MQQITGSRGAVALVACAALVFAAATAGILDTGFDGDGVATVELGTNNYVWAVATQSNGKTLLGGNERGEGWEVRRFNADGSLDTGFATNGLYSAFGDDDLDTVWDIAVDGQDRIYVLGSAGFSATVTTGKGKKQTTTTVVTVKSTVVRLDADGALDTGFGDNGILEVELPDDSEWAQHMLLADGHLLLSGETSVVSGKGRNKTITPAIALMRLDASDGSADSGFDGDGIVIDTADGVWRVRRGLAVDSNGSIYVAIWPESGAGGDRWEIRKYTSAGAGAGSLASSDPDASLEDLVVDADDRVIAVGHLNEGTTEDDIDGLVVRYTAAGALDTGYGTSGSTTTNLPERDILGVVALHGGGIVALGKQWHAGAANEFDTVGFVLRLDANGDADTGFGPGNTAGVSDVVQPGGSAQPETDVADMAIDANGDIVAGGIFWLVDLGNPAEMDWFLARWCGS